MNLGLLGASALLYAVSFPSFLSRWGWFPLAYVCLTPMFWVIRRARWGAVVPYGAFFGFASYALHNFWLGSFHPLTLLIVPPIYSAYFLALFPLLKAADRLVPRWGYLLQTLIWVGYEYLKTQGFLGYSYGILGYSQYLFRPLIQIASFGGVWAVSLLVAFPSAFLAWQLRDGIGGLGRRLWRQLPVAGVYLALLAGAVAYGLLGTPDLSSARAWKVALIQQNVDPWRGGNPAYERSLEILTRLSRQASREDPQIVIWSETSFVPAIHWHTRYRTDHLAYELVRRLREFLAEQGRPYLIGNDDGRLERTEGGREVRVDYNATLLFQDGEIRQVYRKLHLVPFTEYFPYRKLLPGVYEWLRNADTHFWKRGSEHTVFESGGVRFSTPICFEDTFGDLVRRFVGRGAEVVVNMTNDSWSNSVAAEMQHMSIGLFRSVENRRSVVRATNGGITTVIDPTGRILRVLPAFQEGYLVAEVPVYAGTTTLYTRWGDWLAFVVLALAAAGLISGLALRLGRGRAHQD